MKKIELMNLKLRNFKGIEEFNLKADGENQKVFGDNETGKTSLFDGFIWLLFGKDSTNKTNFEIKAVDENGNVKQHGLNHEVEGEFRINEQQFSLKRVYAEEWTKKRGTAQKTFNGHSTHYYIDGVNVRKKDFSDKVSEIISEDIFKLLTNPLYFNQQLGWKQRREILLDISGDVTDQEVAENSDNDNLKAFIEKLNGRNIEDHKKVIRSKQKELNDELDRIPVRIDEIQLSQPNIEGLNKTELETKLENLNTQIESKQERINDIKSGGEVSNKRKELSDIELEITNIKNEHDQQGKQEVYSLEASIQENQSNTKMLESKVESHQNTLQQNERLLEDYNKILAELRQEWVDKDAEEFQHNDECECPTCHQELPKEQVEEVRAKALEKFNQEKAEKLEMISKRGQAKNEEIESVKAVNEKTQKEIDNLKSEIKKLTDKLQPMQDKLETLKQGVTDIAENPQYQAKQQEKESIEKEITQLKESVEESVQAVKTEISELENQKKEVQDDLNKFEIADRSTKRLEELEQQEKDLSAEYEQLDQELFLTETFTRKKVDMLEEKINSKFKYARFKLFEDQLNGGLKETCETLYKGVPYDRGLNNASRINVGLDIINTLNEYYDVYAPIFIDNAESITEIIDIKAQSISLVVSDQYKELDIQDDDSQQQSA